MLLGGDHGNRLDLPGGGENYYSWIQRRIPTTPAAGGGSCKTIAKRAPRDEIETSFV